MTPAIFFFLLMLFCYINTIIHLLTVIISIFTYMYVHTTPKKNKILIWVCKLYNQKLNLPFICRSVKITIYSFYICIFTLTNLWTKQQTCNWAIFLIYFRMNCFMNQVYTHICMSILLIIHRKHVDSSLTHSVSNLQLDELVLYLPEVLRNAPNFMMGFILRIKYSIRNPTVGIQFVNHENVSYMHTYIWLVLAFAKNFWFTIHLTYILQIIVHI